MTNNQLHGKKFEDLIKSCGLFSGSADGGRSPTATFDIEAKYDKILGLPTSIKSTGSNIVGLSDARSFFANSEKYRMLVGRYKQVGPHKQFHNVHEFILTPETLAKLRGEVLLDDVTAFHDGLLLTAFPSAAMWRQGNGRCNAKRRWRISNRGSRLIRKLTAKANGACNAHSVFRN
jgi:hypothetical protein